MFYKILISILPEALASNPNRMFLYKLTSSECQPSDFIQRKNHNDSLNLNIDRGCIHMPNKYMLFISALALVTKSKALVFKIKKGRKKVMMIIIKWKKN
ncbi:CLUMA_CG001379, isoform A [Clunio marinus]|uniref:CLUMA_CG001379, isoform A n=1 Tax=Clunio marinus TaxID=568069 RepID=A0A1J1HMA2_9DIPT|nr:CLUMA_CG001379, isoform A [Clunio marinus]